MSKKNKKGVQNQLIDEPQEVMQDEIIESEPIMIDPAVFETKLFVEEPVAEVPTAIAVDAVEVEPKEFHFEFQETYFIGGGDPNVAPSIDVLPEPCCVCNEPEKSCECTEPCTEPCVCTPEMTPEQEEEGAQIIADMVNDSIMKELKALATPPRSLDSLSVQEMREFRRSGRMPK